MQHKSKHWACSRWHGKINGMNQSQAIEALVKAGWKENGHQNNNLGWKYFSKRYDYPGELIGNHAVVFDYVTVFKNGRIVPGLILPKKKSPCGV